MQATNMPFGIVCAPGQRYHPAIIAQAAATLGEMFPGRFWMSLGSGEYLNESITADPWPVKEARNRRLKECVDVMRRLFAGQTVTHDGLVRVHQAKLYTHPKQPPPIYCAAIGAVTSAWAGEWADGLVTVAGPPKDLRDKIDAFRARAGDKPVFVQAAVSFARDDAQALAAARKNWPICGLGIDQIEDLPNPAAMLKNCPPVDDAQVLKTFRISSSIQQHIDWIAADLEAGATRVYLHHIGPEMERFIDVFGERVLPGLK